MEQSLSLIFAGDACMGKVEDKLDESYADRVLQQVQPILDSADFRIINLENPLTDRGRPIVKSGPALRGAPRNIALLTRGRFDAAILANNHIGDYGEEGVLDTLALLRKHRIHPFGAGADSYRAALPYYAEKNGLTVAVIAVNENEFGVATERKAGSAGFRLGRLTRTVREARALANWVVVVYHGGNEGNPLPSPGVVERFHLLADCGADAVIGMHPHCPQGTEVYRGVPIVYSVGNFFFYENGEDTTDSWYYGYLPKLTFTPGKPVELELFPYRTLEGNGTVLPLQDKQKVKFAAYLARISAPIGDEALLQSYFDGWCTDTGAIYARFLQFDPAMLTDPTARTAAAFGPLRNDYTCEAHNELLRNLLLLAERGEVEKAKARLSQLKAWQHITVD